MKMRILTGLMFLIAYPVWAGQHTGIGGLPSPPPVIEPNETPQPSPTTFQSMLPGSSYEWTSVQGIFEAIKADLDSFTTEDSELSIIE